MSDLSVCNGRGPSEANMPNTGMSVYPALEICALTFISTWKATVSPHVESSKLQFFMLTHLATDRSNQDDNIRKTARNLALDAVATDRCDALQVVASIECLADTDRLCNMNMYIEIAVVSVVKSMARGLGIHTRFTKRN